MDDAPASPRRTVQWIGLLAGPVAAVVCYALTHDIEISRVVDGESVTEPFGPAGRATLGVMAWMAVWWLTEAIDIAATALLPIAIFPLLGIASIKAATAPYASDIIFLFMGGFLLALSMQRWGLDRRIALITLRLVGTRPMGMIGGFMLVTATLSAFVSNTATAAMMLPIALSVVELIRRGSKDDDDSIAGGGNFGVCLMLAIAYAASIGGIATIIGTPPNGILVQFLKEQIAAPHQRDISFVRWLTVGAPLAAVFLPIVWLVLTRVVYPVPRGRIRGGRELIESQYRALGPAGRGEWMTFLVFTCTALLWIVRPVLSNGWSTGIDPATGDTLYAIPPLIPRLSDPGIAMLGGLVLFVIPVEPRRGTFVMNWSTARTLPWGILILFGGGLSLAAAVRSNGVAELIGTWTSGLSGAPTIVLVLAVATLVIFLTELTSNTATTATLVPILAGVAMGLGIEPMALIVPATLAASCAFMMPVATPPNAIVFGSGYITIPQMCKAGLWLNILGIVIVTALTYAVALPLLAG
ncbi:MAG: SLC13 family permease [Planctomycetota bacterium]